MTEAKLFTTLDQVCILRAARDAPPKGSMAEVEGRLFEILHTLRCEYDGFRQGGAPIAPACLTNADPHLLTTQDLRGFFQSLNVISVFDEPASSVCVAEGAPPADTITSGGEGAECEEPSKDSSDKSDLSARPRRGGRFVRAAAAAAAAETAAKARKTLRPASETGEQAQPASGSGPSTPVKRPRRTVRR